MDEKNNNFKYRYLFYPIIALVLSLSIFSYSPEDNSALECGEIVSNYIGNIGAIIARVLFNMIGLSTYVLVILVILWAVRILFFRYPVERKFYFLGICTIILGSSILFAINPHPFVDVCVDLGLGRKELPNESISGGVLGQILVAPSVDMFKYPAGFMSKYIGYVGSIIFAWTLIFSGIIIVYISDWHKIIKEKLANINNFEKTPKDPEKRQKNSAMHEALAALKNKQQTLFVNNTPEVEDEDFEEVKDVKVEEVKDIIEEDIVAPEVIEPVRRLPNVPVVESIAPRDVELNSANPNVKISVQGESVKALLNEYTLPLLTMLGKGAEAIGESPERIQEAKMILQETLDSFGIRGRVTNHISGPRITRYEIMLEPGIKVEKVAGIANNISMDLKAQSIRILAPIPGKNAVGVEAPNVKSEAVFMRQIMESTIWQNYDGEIPIILGKDVAGRSIILDLAKAPHLLIAGSTGSGKSVCMNTLIMSLLFQFSPDDLKLIMVDPKVVELKDYEKLPHLITPVINDSKKVPIALRWAVNEMERRYHILAQEGVKNLKGFNSRPVSDRPTFDKNGIEIPKKLPILVIIIDELADLMMTDAKADVESSIARITAKGRAAGIHIVVATQRPSTNVITGVIKANFPTLISFRVGQLFDSRVILDKKGAETLLCKGDMLYLPPGSADLERVQGAMVDDKDIKSIVKFIADQRPDQDFVADVVADEEEEVEEKGGYESSKPSELDLEMEKILSDEYAPIVAKYSQPNDTPLMKQALEIIVRDKQASTSYLQRRLKIGYNRAAELIDEFEKRGLVGPPGPGGNKREIFIFDEILNQ